MDRVRSRTSKAEVRDVAPQGYFADLNSDGSWDVREDGSYKGYSSPTRRKWLFEHQQRILHDFQVGPGPPGRVRARSRTWLRLET